MQRDIWSILRITHYSKCMRNHSSLRIQIERTLPSSHTRMVSMPILRSWTRKTHNSEHWIENSGRSCIQFSSTQLLSHVRLFASPWITARQASWSITNSWSSLRLTSIKSVMPSSHVILCRPLLLRPPIPPTIRVFSRESTLCMRWPKYWSFSFSIIPHKEIPGLISFRMHWLDLLAVQGTLKSLLQQEKLSIRIFEGRSKLSIILPQQQWKQWQTLFSWIPKSLRMVTAAMNLKDACSLEEKLWTT